MNEPQALLGQATDLLGTAWELLALTPEAPGSLGWQVKLEAWRHMWQDFEVRVAQEIAREHTATRAEILEDGGDFVRQLSRKLDLPSGV